MASTLDQLKATGTVVVCDTGDFNAIATYKPEDATTNPSLILAAAKKAEYASLIDLAINHAASQNKSLEESVQIAYDRLLTEFGKQILDIVPGRVSTEIDARYSFDTQASVQKARELIKAYESMGVDKDRVLIKLAATWEGIKAAEVLQQEGINCNLTLIFSLVQAVAAAEASAFIISPFVGRIMDWHRSKSGRTYTGAEDPGVHSVTSIYQYYKHHDYKTKVMGASFRNVGEIMELGGCDLLTISPNLLEELRTSQKPLEKKLCEAKAKAVDVPQLSYLEDEAKFRFDFNEDAMAVDKLREGISKFSADAVVLKEMLGARLSSKR